MGYTRHYTHNLDIIQDNLDENWLLLKLCTTFNRAYQNLDRYLSNKCRISIFPKTPNTNPEIAEEMDEQHEELLCALGEFDILRDLLFDGNEDEGRIEHYRIEQAQNWADNLLALESKSDQEVVESFVGEGHLRNDMLDEEFVRDILYPEEENANG